MVSFRVVHVLEEEVIEEPVNRLLLVKMPQSRSSDSPRHQWDLRTRHDPPLKIDGVRGTSFVFHDDALKLLVLHLAAINNWKGNWKKVAAPRFDRGTSG